jgi:hypothetical protein
MRHDAPLGPDESTTTAAGPVTAPAGRDDGGVPDSSGFVPEPSAFPAGADASALRDDNSSGLPSVAGYHVTASLGQGEWGPCGGRCRRARSGRSR